MTNNKEPLLIYEGNSFEIMRIQNALEENNITVITNADIHGGLDPNFIAQILVYPKDENKARKIIDDINNSKITETTIIEEIEKNSNNDSIEYKNELLNKPYNIHPLLFCFYFVLSFGVYIFYWFYKTWNYIQLKDQSRQGIPSIIATIFSPLFNFQLFRSIYKLSDKNEEHHNYLSFILPLSIITFWASLRILPYKFYSVTLLSCIPYLPIVFIIRNIEKKHTRKKFITFSELFFILIGIMIWVGYIISIINII